MPQNLGGRHATPIAVFAVILGMAFGLCAIPDSAFGAEKSVFDVEGVAVDARAQDELAAKARGLAAAKQKALQLLLMRLSPGADHDRLPDATPKALDELVRDFSLAAERFGGGRYLAKLTVRFNPSAVRNLLRDQDIPFAETKSLPVLVLPVYRLHGTDLLWDNPNPWFDAWRRVLKEDPQGGDGLLPLVSPRGDLSDLTVISAAQASNGDAAKLKTIARKYKAVSVLVAIATPRIIQGGSSDALSVSVSQFGRELDGAPSNGRDGATTIKQFGIHKDETSQDFFARVARQLFTSVEEAWKKTNFLSESVEQNLMITAPFPGLKEWLILRRRLDGVAPVRHFDIAKLSIHQATLAVRFIGDLGQLKIAMAQRNLDLSYSRDDDQWVMQLRDARQNNLTPK
ncbi:MAG: DUF2066 domain-containing protein [Rhodospirillaceae bacterium]|jgi:hypothetical protein|nr:DUF2066 domain-containing protein [Rhodospirillaceae bacterium]MBT5667246.1 DUF2066 domain-containing protein [Rhodospirillaceae bacterium]MBT5810120.1 DUF2066 domain-containing protein [Rhodospirillaceae bacterium]